MCDDTNSRRATVGSDVTTWVGGEATEPTPGFLRIPQYASLPQGASGFLSIPHCIRGPQDSSVCLTASGCLRIPQYSSLHRGASGSLNLSRPAGIYGLASDASRRSWLDRRCRHRFTGSVALSISIQTAATARDGTKIHSPGTDTGTAGVPLRPRQRPQPGRHKDRPGTDTGTAAVPID